MSVAYLRYWYEWYVKSRDDTLIPAEIRIEWCEYLEHVQKMETPEDRRYLEIHEGHCTFQVPSERRFVTPNVIRAARGYVGEPDDIIEWRRERERAGLHEITILPPIHCARQVYQDFADQIIARY